MFPRFGGVGEGGFRSRIACDSSLITVTKLWNSEKEKLILVGGIRNPITQHLLAWRKTLSNTIFIHNLLFQPQWSFLGFRITGFMPLAVEEDSNWYLHCPGGSIDEDEREVKAQELWTTTKMDPLVSDFWHLLSKAGSLLVDSFQKEYFQNVASFCQSLSITIVSQITGSHKRPNKQTNQLMWRQKMNIWWENKPFPSTGIFDNWLHSCQNYYI